MQIRGRVSYYGNMEKNEKGNKICPKCQAEIQPDYKLAYQEEVCPYCGYNMAKIRAKVC